MLRSGKTVPDTRDRDEPKPSTRTETAWAPVAPHSSARDSERKFRLRFKGNAGAPSKRVLCAWVGFHHLCHLPIFRTPKTDHRKPLLPSMIENFLCASRPIQS